MDLHEWMRFACLFFVDAFCQGFTSHLFLLVEVAAIGGVLFLRLGSGMGLPLLFWHENPWKQALAGCASVLLLPMFFGGTLIW